ncbi:Cof-type HAD-IIB family hydrolase [Lacticaseibacillus thailandensis]|uniref:HAD superfamily hydrolase n=1 Tax=Lacticaseibacillus thailandensis DSM 22698 = JCM 13996 TaxID=1423810 RepID=A0A0R2CBS9_9LACO|nr:HAD family hydrolase [Lacticaseibacillus thailandensis]KRM87476.1 HAD superfamily hydrolase [Lacticaseibacillus thailandensis DSM 22698 = JCM 13996]
MYKLIVSDLDETLLREDGTISAANVAAIKAARDRGVKFVPNTGRSFTSVQDLLHTLGLAGRDDQYVIAYNGGATVSNDHNRVVAVNPMAYDVARRIFAITKTFPETDTHVYTLNEVFLYKPRADDIQYMQTRGAAYTVMPDDDFSRFQNLQIMKVIAMNPDPAVQKAIADQVMSALDQRLNLTFSSGIYTEFNPLGVDKGVAALQLGAALGIKRDEIIGIGDNLNDLALLQQVGMPVAVANGRPEIKAAAKLVTQADYESGVAEMIHKLILD